MGQITVDQITAKKAFITDNNGGGFLYEEKDNVLMIHFYAPPKGRQVQESDYAKMAQDAAAELTRRGYDYLVSNATSNLNVLKGLSQIEGVRFFRGYDEVSLEDIVKLEAASGSFDCKTLSDDKNNVYRVSIPLNGKALPPFAWYSYDGETGKVLRTYDEKPEGKGLFGASDLFKVGDEEFNDHFVDLETGRIKTSRSKSPLMGG